MRALASPEIISADYSGCARGLPRYARVFVTIRAAVPRRAHSHEQQIKYVEDATATIMDDDAPYALLVIDSVMALFRVDYVGRGELAERQQKLNKHLNAIKKRTLHGAATLLPPRSSKRHLVCCISQSPRSSTWLSC